VTVEAVGHTEVMKQAFHARDHAGTMVQVGVPNPQVRVDLRMLDFYGRGGSLRPAWYGDCLPTRDFPILIDLYLRGRYDLDRFVSETIALDQVEEAFAKMQRTRCCARWWSSAQPGRDDRPGRVAVLDPVAACWGRRPGASVYSQCSSSCWATPAAGPQWLVIARTSASDGMRPSR
jgi:hypothetical protein